MSDRLTPDEIVDGRYKILSRLGSGGMADVYCAEDMQLGRKVALKMLYRRFAEDSEFVERFRREASSAAGLQHPNVVAVYDRGEEDGTQYIAMEYVEGRSLKDVVRSDGPLDPARAIDLVAQILRAARFAHKRGIVHRDLKPHNVIVSADDRAKVTDFGIARAGASDMTQTGSIMGTAQYLSPEQAQGLPVSPQSDLYSVGIVLYELLTARVPFDGESAVAIALQQVGAEPVSPSQLNPGVTHELEQVVLRALEKDPAKRFADADEFLEALEAARASLPLSAATTGTTPLRAPEEWTPGPEDTAALPVVEPFASSESLVQYGFPVDAPGPVPESEGGGRKWWLALLAVLVVAGLVVGGLLLFGTRQVSVPMVVGDAEAVAEQTLSAKGFSTQAQTRVSTQPKGQVIAQKPGAGKKAKKGSRILLTVSGGPGQAQIPVLGDKGHNAATKQLEALGFTVTEVDQSDPTIKKNHVIQTDPPAGERLDKGSAVKLIVSSGPAMVTVPNVVGKTQQDAETALVAAGLQSKAKQQESADKTPGTVLSQEPAAGKPAVKDSTVTITVAIAQTEFDVPNVVGKSQDDAVATLSGEGFKVVTTPKTVTDSTQDGIVLSQTPTGGKLKKGQTVNITVGRVATISTTGTTTTTPTTTGGSP